MEDLKNWVCIITIIIVIFQLPSIAKQYEQELCGYKVAFEFCRR